jgi:PAS domain S-box-containing protein
MRSVFTVLNNLPIARKIGFAILLTCSLALTVTAAAIFVAQLMTFRLNFNRDLEATGQMIGQTATAAITFKDRTGAADILSAFSAKPHILRASLDLPDGSEFAAFQRANLAVVPGAAKTDGAHSVGPYLLLNQPVMLAGERIATLRLLCDYQTQYRSSLRMYAAILGSALLVSVLLALALSSRLQRLISSPVLSLADTARAVAEQKDYSLRAPVRFHDEVGELTTAFNQMLSQLGEETAARRQSEADKEIILATAQIGIIIVERDSHTIRYVNQTAQKLAGRTRENLLGQRCHSVICPAQAGRCPITDLHQQVDQSERVLLGENGDRIPIIKSVAAVIYEGRPCLIESFIDISERKKAEQVVENLHKELVTASRHAGMAEVATGVLHNVGNVLNSVNISVNLVQDRLKGSRISDLTRLSSLMKVHRADLGAFLTSDPKGRRIPEFVSQLGVLLQEEHAQIVSELQTLQRNVEHIKEIVAMQQTYAKVAGVVEDIAPAALMEDAIRMNENALHRHGVVVKRDFEDVPPVRADRHKTLQILINLFRNARHAMEATECAGKVLTLGLTTSGHGRVKFTVRDNGTGIAPDNLTRIFAHGFTTKRDGHGFGLHSGANAAKEMGGVLEVFSDGPGTGATFVLELPVAPKPETKTEPAQQRTADLT